MPPAMGAASPGVSRLYGVVRLASWPDLMALSADAVPLAARVCALVACKPTTASLIPLILDAPKDAVFRLLDRLHLDGHLEWDEAAFGSGPSQAAAGPSVPAAAASTAAKEAPSPAGALVNKLWNRLLGHRQ